MKKLISVIMIMTIFVSVPLAANALIYAEYGGPLLRDSFESSDGLTSYPYTSKLNGNAGATITSYNTSTVRSGDKSILIDMSGLAVGESAAFARTVYNKGIDPTVENYHVSYYLKGENLTLQDIQFHYYYDGNRCGAYSWLKTELCHDGWIKVEALLPHIPDYNLSQSGYVGVLLIKRENGPQFVYMDDMEVSPAPEKIDFEDRNISSAGEFNLDEIKAVAYSPVGTTEDLPNTKFIEWKVVSENAEIENRKLIYDRAEEKIVLSGNFLGCTDEVILYVSDNVKETTKKPDLTAGEISETDGIYSVDVLNNGTVSGTATLVLAVYENGRLCDIDVVCEMVLPGRRTTLTGKKITGADVKISVWDNIFGCIAIKN